MKRAKKRIVSLVVMVLVLSLFSPMVHTYAESGGISSNTAEMMEEYRLALPNGDRYSTAAFVALSQYNEAKTVIIVRGDSVDGIPQVVDALAASGLAGVENAPILLTHKNRLPSSTIEAIGALGAEIAVIIGGPQAVSLDVEKELGGLDLEIERISTEGGNRYTTAVEVGERMMEKSPTDTAMIVGGEALVDSLVAGPLAHNRGYPLLLVQKKVPEVTGTFITEHDIKKLIVVGGPAVVSEQVFSELEDLVGVQGEVIRIAGDSTYGENRFGTSINFYKTFFKEAESISLVNGRSFVDAVAASILGQPILYVDQNNLRPDVESILKEKSDFRIIGGPVVVSDEVLAEAFYTLHPDLKPEEPEEPDRPNEIHINTTKYPITLREMVDIQTSFVRITGSTVNVREEPAEDPGNTNNVIGKVFKDDDFNFNDTRRVTDKATGTTYTWYEIDLRNSSIDHDKGWVRGDLVRLFSRGQTDLYGVGLNGSIWQDARREDVEYYVNPANFNSNYDSEHSVETIWNNTNIRRDASTNNPELTQVNAGEIFTYVSTTEPGDGFLWYEIDVQRLNLVQDTGWLREDVVKKLEGNALDISSIPTSFFQFLVLSGQSGANTGDLNNILNNRGVLHNTGELFIQAGKQYNINEIYLVSHALLETGNGGSALATGAIRVGEIDPNRWVSVQPQSDGKDKKMIAHRYLVEGSWRWNIYEDENFDLSKVDLKKTYNMFGIGAVDSAPYTRGSVEAFRQGWLTSEKAIVEGSQWISLRYVNHSTYRQDTLYKMRWNPERPGIHQYATDIGWAVKQTSRIKSLYGMCESYNLRFDVPEYRK